MIRGSMGVGDKADGFVLAIVLILFSVITISINQKLIGTRKSYETIGGRGFMAQLSKLGIDETSHIYSRSRSFFKSLSSSFHWVFLSGVR